MSSKRTTFSGAIRRDVIQRRKTAWPDQSWFYHPEMQARIARAEDDLREGRYRDFASKDELFAYLDSPKRS